MHISAKNTSCKQKDIIIEIVLITIISIIYIKKYSVQNKNNNLRIFKIYHNK